MIKIKKKHLFILIVLLSLCCLCISCIASLAAIFFNININSNRICDEYINGSLRNISITNIQTKEYSNIKDAIIFYPWNTQFLPVADVYCNIPFNIKFINFQELSHESNIYTFRVDIKEGFPNYQEYNPIVTVEFNSNTNTYKVIRVNRFTI